MTNLVGILNLTPDSFSDGGKWHDNEDIKAHFLSMLHDGATIIDVGAESTRPKAIPLSADEEWKRLNPILPILCKLGQVSLDTRHAATAHRAIECGVTWINDVSGIDDEMAATLKNSHCRVVFMHSLSVPANPQITMDENIDAVTEIISWAEQKILTLQSQGIGKERLIFDPGLGFGKNAAQSWQIIERAAEFKSLGIPMLFGHSRKSFIGGDVNQRDEATLAISRKLAANGVDYLRVHNVKIHRNL